MSSAAIKGADAAKIKTTVTTNAKHAGVKTDGIHDSALGTLVDMQIATRKRPDDQRFALDSVAAGGAPDFEAIFRPKSA